MGCSERGCWKLERDGNWRACLVRLPCRMRLEYGVRGERWRGEVEAESSDVNGPNGRGCFWVFLRGRDLLCRLVLAGVGF